MYLQWSMLNVISKINKSRLKKIEIKSFRKTLEYTLLYKKRNKIAEELGVESVEDKIHKYKLNCLNLV